MSKILSIGDNVVDCYLDDGICYPGGDAVNVAVHAKRCGAARVRYAGIFGDDPESDHIIDCLTREGVEVDLSRRMYARSSHPGVRLDENMDRIFVGGPRNTAQQIARMELTVNELKQAGEFDLCHTTCYAMLEHELPTLSGVIDISFDFSTYYREDYIAQVAPYVKYAFFSGQNLSSEDEISLAGNCLSQGVSYVIVTHASEGAKLYTGSEVHYCPAVSIQPVDAMGAGDSFIAAFLVAALDHESIDNVLSKACAYAAGNCLSPGAFGYPMKLPPDYVHRIDEVRQK